MRIVDIGWALAAGVFGGAVGWLAWRPPDLFVLLWMLPIAWSLLARQARMAMMLGYAMAALWSVAQSVSAYYPGPHLMYGYVIWLSVSLCVAAPWMIAAWVPRRTGLAWGIATLIEALPPLGAIGMASPLLAATAAFPGLGLGGLALSLILQMLLASSIRPPMRLIALATTCVIASVAQLTYHPAHLNHHWVALQTRMGGQPQSAQQWIDRQVNLRKEISTKLSQMPKDSVLLTPEVISGTWGTLSPLAWSKVARQASVRNDTLLLGAFVPISGGAQLDALLLLGAHHGLFTARQPIPLTEWNPLGRAIFPAHWLDFGPRFIGNTPVALAVCYEQLLVWPLAWSFVSSTPPVILLAPSNHGWDTSGAVEIRTQHNTATAWARLYGVPVLIADDLPPRNN